MQLIGGFLERYKRFTTPSLAAARAVRAAIKETLGIDVPESAIKVKNGRAEVSLEPIAKTELLLNAEGIIARTRALVGDAVRGLR